MGAVASANERRLSVPAAVQVSAPAGLGRRRQGCRRGGGGVMLPGDSHNNRHILEVAPQGRCRRELRRAGSSRWLLATGLHMAKLLSQEGDADVGRDAFCDPCGCGGRQPRGVAVSHAVSAMPRHHRCSRQQQTAASGGGVRCGGPTAAAFGSGRGGATARSIVTRRPDTSSSRKAVSTSTKISI